MLPAVDPTQCRREAGAVHPMRLASWCFVLSQTTMTLPESQNYIFRWRKISVIGRRRTIYARIVPSCTKQRRVNMGRLKQTVHWVWTNITVQSLDNPKWPANQLQKPHAKVERVFGAVSVRLDCRRAAWAGKLSDVAEVMRETPTARLQRAPSPRQRLLSVKIEIRARYKATEQAIGPDEGRRRDAGRIDRQTNRNPVRPGIQTAIEKAPACGIGGPPAAVVYH